MVITKSTSLVLALLLVATAGAFPVTAATYYVAPSGSDGNPGTQASPWQTLQHAADVARAGDTVVAQSGRYAGFVGVASGAEGNPITFTGSGGAGIIDGASSNGQDNINLEGTDWIVIQEFRVENAPRVGIRVAESSNVVVQRNTIAVSGWWGILAGFTPNLQVLDNTVFGSIEQHGIYLANSRVANDAIVVRGNESYGNNWSGIQINGDCLAGGDGVISGAILEDNYLHDNFGKGFSLISMQNSVVRNNIVINNGINNGAGGIHLTDEPTCGNPSNFNIIVNNTIVEDRIAVIRATDDATGNFIFNNIIIATGSNPTVDDQSGGNLVDPASNLIQTSTSGVFQNPAGNDFHLLDTSPAIDRGTGDYLGNPAPLSDYAGNTRPMGASHDAGAYEFGASTDTQAPDVALTAPASNATLSGSVTLSADASDDTGVLGVRFQLDGAQVGLEVTQAPYEITVNTASWSNGAHTLSAVARDAGGNTGTSNPVAVTVDNFVPPPPDGIIQQHPRLLLANGRLQRLRALACYDDAGNSLQNCSPDPRWTTFFKWVQAGNGEAWAQALAYQITQDVSFANAAIAAADARVAGDIGAISAADNHMLYVHNFLRDVAVVYDWCYDVLPQAKRAAYRDYLYKIIHILWKPGPSGGTGVETEMNVFGFGWSGWATQDPGSNYYANHLLATAYAVIATRYEGDFPYTLPYPNLGPDYTDPLEFLNAKIDQQLNPELRDRGEGGGWLEGENYGELTKMLLFEMFVILRDAGAGDHFYDTAFAQQAAHYQFYTIQPGYKVMYTGGDLARDQGMPVNPYERFVMLLLTDGLAGTDESAYTQFWLRNFSPAIPTGWSFLYAWDFLLTDNTLPQRDFRTLPTDYWARGVGWVHSRSSWQDDALALTFVSTDRIQGHMHADQNAFVIYRGNSGSSLDGWQVADVHPWSSGLPRHSIFHNTILVNGQAQRFGLGTGKIERYEAHDQMVYMKGDAGDAYWTNGFDFSHGDEKLLDVFDREIIHVVDQDLVVVFDRVAPTSKFPSANIVNLFHYPGSAPGVQGDLITHDNGVGKVFQNVLLPATQKISVVQDDNGSTWRVELTDSQQRSLYTFLNAFYVAGSGTSVQPTLSVEENPQEERVVLVIEGTGTPIKLGFSTNAAGLTTGAFGYTETGALTPTNHFLYDLPPNVDYSVDVAQDGDVRHIWVHPGSGYRTSPAGVLSFRVEPNAEQPVLVSR